MVRNRLVPWKQLKKYHTFSIPPNRQHNLFLIPFNFRCCLWWSIKLGPWSFSNDVIVSNPFFITSDNSFKKRIEFIMALIWSSSTLFGRPERCSSLSEKYPERNSSQFRHWQVGPNPSTTFLNCISRLIALTQIPPEAYGANRKILQLTIVVKLGQLGSTSATTESQLLLETCSFDANTFSSSLNPLKSSDYQPKSRNWDR